MDLTTVDVLPLNYPGLPREQLAKAREHLGPDPCWDGYDGITDPVAAKKAWGLVGNIHGYCAKVGNDIITIGSLLLQLKELLPHGQFTSCVKAEFGWSGQWSDKLMRIAERFSNRNPGFDLPSSVHVLYELAQAGADDETVRQAADESWTREEARNRLGRGPAAPRAPQPAEALALGLLRKAEPDQIAPAIELLRLAAVVTPEQVMAEQRLRELGRQRFIPGADADFHRMKDGRWIRLPHAGRVDVSPAPEPPPADPEPAPDDSGKVLALDDAAQRLGLKTSSLRQMLTPAKNPGGLIRHGFHITRAGRGFVRLVQMP